MRDPFWPASEAGPDINGCERAADCSGWSVPATDRIAPDVRPAAYSNSYVPRIQQTLAMDLGRCAGGERHEPVDPDSRRLRATAPEDLTDPPPGQDDRISGPATRIAGLDDHVTEVDSRDVGIALYEAAPGAYSGAAFVVDG